jgi:DNA-binding response OmpR family regulator
VSTLNGERILLVEDDDVIANSLVRALTATGYTMTLAATGEAALAFLAQETFDLVVLDLGLPDMDGLDVCRHIRTHDSLLPVVLLTARQEEIDIVIGLDSGAVDYITKPFRLAELQARLRVQLRRADTSNQPAKEMYVGQLRLNVTARKAWWRGQELDLRAKEFDLLVRLVATAGSVVTREDLMSDVWDEHWFGSTKTLDVHIASLRKRLSGPGPDDTPITTVRGIGYRYELT